MFSGDGKKDKILVIAAPDGLIGKLVFVLPEIQLMRMMSSIVMLLIGMVGETSLSDIIKDGTLSLHGSYPMIFLIINCVQLQPH